MRKSKSYTLLVVVLAMTAGLAACAPKPVTYKDGTYRAPAAEADASGWKEYVEVKVESGKITKVTWDATWDRDDTIKKTKKEYSREGLLGMAETGGAKSERYEQAEAAEKHVVEKNGTSALEIKTGEDAGKSDAISGATIKVDEFKRLVDKALVNAKK